MSRLAAATGKIFVHATNIYEPSSDREGGHSCIQLVSIHKICILLFSSSSFILDLALMSASSSLLPDMSLLPPLKVIMNSPFTQKGILGRRDLFLCGLGACAKVEACFSSRSIGKLEFYAKGSCVPYVSKLFFCSTVSYFPSRFRAVSSPSFNHGRQSWRGASG